MILLQDWINVVKPEIAKEILKMRKLLEVENFWRKTVLKIIDFLYCNFIIVKQS